MPIEKITADQFAASIRTGITSRNNSYDVAVGPIPDLVIRPHSRVLERQNDRTRKLSLMLSLTNANEFEGTYESDLEGIIFNEGVTRNTGAQATVTVTFSRGTEPTADLVVQRGYPMGTTADESTGQTITFIATEERRMSVAAAASFYNPDTDAYELSVPAVAVIEGETSSVGANRITRTLRPLVGFDSFTNATAASGGRDRETNQESIDRYLLSILGRQIGTPLGTEKFTRDDFPAVEDALVVYGDDELLTRSDEDAGAVDVFIVGAQTVTVDQNLIFSGAGQLMALSQPPITNVLSVRDTASAAILIAGTDYNVEFDTSGVARSSRAVEGVRFLSSATVLALTPGTPITVTYAYDNLIRQLQTTSVQEEYKALGADVLFRKSTQVDLAHEANLRVLSGFNATTVRLAVTTAVDNYIDGLKLGDDVEESDIQAVVRQISGVDNYIITRNTRATVAAGTGDIAIARNEFPRIASTDLIITEI